MTTAWAHLPNAKHIDRVLASLKSEPDKWGAARAATRDAARDAARSVAKAEAAGEASTGDAARGTAWAAARDAAWEAARGAAWAAARDAISALVAWDDCTYLLSFTPVQVQAHIKLTNDPAAILLLPAVIVFSTGKA